MPHQCTNCGRTFEDGSKEMLSGCPDCGGNKFQFRPASAAAGNAGDGAGSAAPATEPKKTPENARSASDAPETGGRDDSETGANSGAVNRAAATVRDWVSTRDDAESAPARDDAPVRNDAPARDDAPARNDASARDDAEGASGRDDAPPAGETSAAGSVPDSESDGSGSTRNGSALGEPSNEDSAQANARSDVVTDSELPDSSDDAAQVGSASADADDANVVSAPDDDSPGLKELREELNSQFESIRIVSPGQYELNLMELYEREEYIISLQEDGKYVIEVPDAWDATER